MMDENATYDEALKMFLAKQSEPGSYDGLVELFSIPLHASVRGLLDPTTGKVSVHVVQTDADGVRDGMEDSVLTVDGPFWSR